jgi:CRP/FNR family cyclic AMP-dependent transcriptional regulator
MVRNPARGDNVIPAKTKTKKPKTATRTIVSKRDTAKLAPGTTAKPAMAGRSQPAHTTKLMPASSFDFHSFLATLGSGRASSNYRTKAVVYHQGDPADAVYFIESGKIKLTVVSEHGKEGVIAILEAGDFFGEGCLAGQPLNMASASAMAKSTVSRIEKRVMISSLQQNPDMSEMFMGFLLSRNIQIEADLVDQLFNSSERRLARLLLMMSNFGKEGKMETVLPRINQDILAAKIGTTRSRINFFMNKFRKLGFIEYNGGLKVHSSLLNVIVHE